MDHTPRLTGDEKGHTLVELLICLALISLLITTFSSTAVDSARADMYLADQVRAERVLAGVRSFLAAEDPWAAPASRSYSLDAAGNAVPASATSYDVTITATGVCSGWAYPLDNQAEPAEPGGCAAQTALRRWEVVVSYPSRTDASGRRTVVGWTDVGRDAHSRGWSAGSARP